jgi:hypothetical protein
MAAISPDLALAYVRELSTDVRAGVVLSAGGELLAGDPALAAPARALLACAEGPDVAVRTGRGVVVAARGAGGGAGGAGGGTVVAGAALVVVCGPLAIPEVTALDARAAVDAMGPVLSGTPDSAPLREVATPCQNDVREAAEAVISATQLAF